MTQKNEHEQSPSPKELLSAFEVYGDKQFLYGVTSGISTGVVLTSLFVVGLVLSSHRSRWACPFARKPV
jgi:hypothetical protein